MKSPLDVIDWDDVARTFKKMDWKWFGASSFDGIPTANELREHTYRMIADLKGQYSAYTWTSSGRITVMKIDKKIIISIGYHECISENAFTDLNMDEALR